MAVEQSPGTKRGTEPAASTPSQPTPAAPAIDPAELAAARAEAAELKRQHAAELEQIRTALSDPDTIDALARAAKARSGASSTTTDEDDTALVDRRELKRQHEELKRQVAGALGAETARGARQIRATQVELLKPTLPHYKRYESEITALLDKIDDPRQAANAETIQNVYKLVVSQHADELQTETEKRVRQEERERLRARGYDIEDDDNEADEEEPERPTVSAKEFARATGASGAAPASSVSVSRTTRQRERSTAQWGSRDEKVAAGLFGINSPEEFKKYGDKNWKPDIMGFKGRDRV